MILHCTLPAEGLFAKITCDDDLCVLNTQINSVARFEEIQIFFLFSDKEENLMKNLENLQFKRLQMTTRDLRSLLDLQDKIIANFKPEEQNFILHRTIDDFSNALKSDHMYVFGLYDGDRLVSQSILSLPGNKDKRDLPEFAGEYKNSEIAVYKAVLVDPEYRGHGLMKVMLRERERVAKEHGRKLAITQIAAKNPASWVNAVQYGMQIMRAAHDPEDNAEVIYLQKRLDGEKDPRLMTDKTYAIKYSKEIPWEILFNKMVNISKAGWVGTAWDKENNNILWHRRASTAEKVLCGQRNSNFCWGKVSSYVK